MRYVAHTSANAITRSRRLFAGVRWLRMMDKTPLWMKNESDNTPVSMTNEPFALRINGGTRSFGRFS